ncbi:MAG: translation initiation factor IF-2 [Syntrophobacteraceae bacterium]
MDHMRVHELAKELNMSNEDLMDRILKLGIQAKNHMSTLTDSAVLQIRRQLAESRSEMIEEKRIARGVIRRRKRVVEEAEIPEGEVVHEKAGAVAEPVEPRQVEIPEPLIQSAKESAASVSRAPELPAEEEGILEPPVENSEIEPMPEPSIPLEEPMLEAADAEHKDVETLPQYAREKPKVEIAEPEPAAKIIKPAPPKLHAVEPVVTPAPAPVVVPEEVLADLIEEAVEGEEEEDKGKPKKAKKRRRKKTRKDEPAKIIKLPEIIPEEPEPEEEVELTQLAARLLVKTEDTETKEVSRKKRKQEEFEKEALERKRKGLAPVRRKEVVEKEDLYSKKELAAQQDRERVRERERRHGFREAAKPEPLVPKLTRRPIKIDEAITVANLAKQMGVKAGELIKKLLVLGLPAHINQALDFDTAALLASEYEFEVEKVGFEEEDILQVAEDRQEDLIFRPPVVTVMGHVDHGKTSLLDAIRHTDVIGGEAGGITQHIGAYYVKLENGDVVFLDTPGHEAFTSMRARGAKVTDIVILMVAADDGVMQQTIEAINHAKAAEVPIIVAINKIDKPNANLERVRRELAEHGLISGEWGGDTTIVEVSAKKLIGIEELLEMVLLQAEVMELKANPHKAARGHVIEAKLDKGRGPVATILIQEGTLRAGDVYVCGVNSGRVRNMFNDKGQRIEEAGPSMPIEVLGLSGVPNAGDDFIVLTDEKQAKMVAEFRLAKLREKELTRTTKVTLESLFEQIQVGEIKELNVILKTDVHGSQEAIADSLRKLSTAEVKVNLLHTATGAVTESDILLASASNAIVIGFNVRADAKVHELAEQENVDVRYYDIIYQLLSDIHDAMEGLLEPIYQENVLGRAEVRQTFMVPKSGMIAGSYVLDGRVERNAKVRVLRDNVVVYDGKLNSLRRFKDDVKEVKAGFECGMGVENFNDIKVNDILEVYELQAVKATLSSEPEKRAGG